MILVTGAGGFIGGHLVKRLLDEGHEVRAVDVKPPSEWHQPWNEAQMAVGDLRDLDRCHQVCNGIDTVYNLAADMGGMGFIENNKALCMLSVVISTGMLDAALHNGVQRFFYSSSACVYPDYAQRRPQAQAGLTESMAYPAMPEDGYGWEKLFSERMARHFFEDFGLETRVARYHNVYGPHGTWEGGREKAPAAICRKVAQAVHSGIHEIEIWGDGQQTRSFTYIDDCVEGTLRLTSSDVREPLNVGSDELISIDRLVTIVEGIAGVTLKRSYLLDAPQGVRGRNSDNTLIRELLDWSPSIPPEEGLEQTYRWIYDQMMD